MEKRKTRRGMGMSMVKGDEERNEDLHGQNQFVEKNGILRSSGAEGRTGGGAEAVAGMSQVEEIDGESTVQIRNEQAKLANIRKKYVKGTILNPGKPTTSSNDNERPGNSGSGSRNSKTFQQTYVEIPANLYSGCKPYLTDVSAEVCGCFAREKSGRICYKDSGCGNAATQVGCTERTCGDEKRCRNRVTKFDPEHFALFETQKKGMGLKTTVDIKKGDFVLQYVGEVIPIDTYLSRYRSKKLTDPVYFMQLERDQFIDAEQMGNISRYINHSCEGNCRTDVYVAGKRTVLCIFAKTNIRAGTELSYDYAFDMVGEPRKCFCGSKSCRGTINKPMKWKPKARDSTDEDGEPENGDHQDLDMAAESLKPTSSRQFFTKRNTKRDHVYDAPKVPSKKDSRFQCYPCHKRFKTIQSLNNHNQIHVIPAEQRTCKYCIREPFTQLSSLKRHVEVEHPAEYKIDYKK